MSYYEETRLDSRSSLPRSRQEPKLMSEVGSNSISPRKESGLPLRRLDAIANSCNQRLFRETTECREMLMRDLSISNPIMFQNGGFDIA